MGQPVFSMEAMCAFCGISFCFGVILTVLSGFGRMAGAQERIADVMERDYEAMDATCEGDDSYDEYGEEWKG